MKNGEDGDGKATENRGSGHGNWRQHTLAKLLFVGVAAGTSAGLTALLWPTIHKPLGLDVNTLVATLIVAVAFIVIGVLAYFVAEKTLWELLELLIVPLVIAVIGLWFTVQQDTRQTEIDQRRVQDDRLQAYVEYMGTLILDEGFAPQSEGTENDKIVVAMKARTLEVLNALDSVHKGRVVVFLYGAELLSTPPNPSVLRLGAADLSGAKLNGTALRDIYLGYANLSNADLSNVIWGSAILEDTDLRGAKISAAYLSEAYLNHSDISCTKVGCADLSNADLSGADLSNANLSGADLGGAEGTNEEKLEQQGAVLQGATMPDGSEHP